MSWIGKPPACSTVLVTNSGIGFSQGNRKKHVFIFRIILNCAHLSCPTGWLANKVSGHVPVAVTCIAYQIPGQAAERCFVSQPTLSGQIKKLEEELGVTVHLDAHPGVRLRLHYTGPLLDWFKAERPEERPYDLPDAVYRMADNWNVLRPQYQPYSPEDAALVDALMQSDAAGAVRTAVLEPLEDEMALAKAIRAAKAAAIGPSPWADLLISSPSSPTSVTADVAG